MRATMSQGGYVITPTLDRPGTITFYHRASGSGKHIVVEKSIDGGTSWTQIGEATVSSSTPYGMSSCNANSAEDDTQVLIKFTNKDGSTIYLDDVTINVGSGGSSGGGGGDEPVNPGGQPEEEWTGPHPTEHVIYIAPNGNDATGDGTWENPYYNLQKAVDLVAGVDPNILLILQPVTPLNGVEAARPEQMLELQQQALESLNDVRIIPQTHRMMDQL